ncbi:DUF2461 domain-containing protein (plasmid) [Rhizobium leguminosarum]|nr:DUF2461 domain-containing protein [Rhizobium leguminosarum]
MELLCQTRSHPNFSGSCATFAITIKKDWFDANRTRYQQHVQQPMLSFIETMSPWLAAHTPAFLADTRTNGGSLFRIYRDTRFSSDKSPFKTNVGCNFRHRIGKDAHAPGFYVHISPDEIFFGGGIWSPPTPVLNNIRDAIVAQPDRWRAIVGGKAFTLQLGGLAESDTLKTVPRGYAKDHPFAHDLQRKSIYAFASCTEEQVCAVDFPDKVMTAFATLAPLMKFTTDALGLRWK